jgi:hypothetical protein
MTVAERQTSAVARSAYDNVHIKVMVKVKFRPITGHEDPVGRSGIALLFL